MSSSLSLNDLYRLSLVVSSGCSRKGIGIARCCVGLVLEGAVEGRKERRSHRLNLANRAFHEPNTSKPEATSRNREAREAYSISHCVSRPLQPSAEASRDLAEVEKRRRRRKLRHHSLILGIGIQPRVDQGVGDSRRENEREWKEQ